MSFAMEVKEEILSLDFTQEQKIQLLSGFIKYNGDLLYSNGKLRLSISSTSNFIIRKIISFSKEFFKGNIEISIIQTQTLRKSKVYQLTFIDRVADFLNLLNIYNFEENAKIITVSNDVLENTGLLRAYIAGIFIAVGSVNSPRTTNYHLEIQAKDKESSDYIIYLISRFGINFKSLSRKNKFICYIKRSILVSDFLKLINATNAVMNFENVRIERDFNNSLNRVLNIEIYNQQKTTTTGEKQIILINEIKDNGLFFELSKKAQMLSNLRIDNVDASYSELEEILNQKGISITKSGISNLFKIIQKLADDNRR